MVDKICVECSKGFSVYKYRKDSAKFCGMRCLGINTYKNHPENYHKQLKKELHPFFGKHHTEKSKEKNRLAHLGKRYIGRKNGKMSEEHRKSISLSLKGKKPKNMEIIGIGVRGERNRAWKGGMGTERHRLMGQIEYKLWRQAVFARDDWTCQECSVRGGKLEADHIKPWALYPELRYAIDNGRTLCITCHRQTDTWGYRVYSVERVLG